MKDYNKLLEEVKGNLQKFSEKNPEQMGSFQKLMESVEKDGKLESKTKHLISIGCAIVSHCEWCIAYHVSEALKQGASEEEIMESTWTGVLMGGGPSLMYAQGVLKALEDFKKE